VTASVGVVICCYTERRWDPLLAALRSVQRQTRAPDRTVVVVDHNGPLLDRLAAVAGPGVVVLASTGPPGLSGARNTGVAACATTVVAFLDDDAVAEPDWLEALVAEYADPAVVAVGGRIEPRWEQGRPAWFPDEFGWVVGCSYRGQPAGRAVVRNVIGANMSVRAGALGEVGGFAESLGRTGAGVPMGGEETELCIRLAAAGGTVLQQPAAVVHHLVPGSRGTVAYFRSRCWAEGRSKAGVSRLAGASAALSAERDYATRVLPRGVLREARRALGRGDRAAAGRGAAIVGGLLTTAAGYALGRVRDLVTRPGRPGPAGGTAAAR
jgi:GT2 family glycosyltransferase